MRYEWKGTIPPPDFDQELADHYIGKRILIGLTNYSHEGIFLEQIQMHGVIKSAGAEGVIVALMGSREGETWTMPADFRSVKPAAPGLYTLRSTGEVVENPDLLVTWSITKPKQS